MRTKVRRAVRSPTAVTAFFHVLCVASHRHGGLETCFFPPCCRDAPAMPRNASLYAQQEKSVDLSQRPRSLYSSRSSMGPTSDVAGCGRLPAWCVLHAEDSRSHASGRIGMLQCSTCVRRSRRWSNAGGAEKACPFDNGMSFALGLSTAHRSWHACMHVNPTHALPVIPSPSSCGSSDGISLPILKTTP
jgi:hypothetical protein